MDIEEKKINDFINIINEYMNDKINYGDFEEKMLSLCNTNHGTPSELAYLIAEVKERYLK